MNLTELLERYQDTFVPDHTAIKDAKAEIHIKAGAVPKFHKPRSVPYALRDKVEAELTRLQRLDIIKPVDRSKWAAPVVTVIKADGSVIPHSHYSRECASVRIDAHSRIRTIHTTATMRSEAHSMSKRSEAKRSEANSRIRLLYPNSRIRFASLRYLALV